MLKSDAYQIIDYAIEQNKPDKAIKENLKNFVFNSGKLIVIAVGKASYLMAKAAREVSSKRIDIGVIITKENYSLGNIEGFEIYEASHPVLKQSTIDATERVLKLTENLKGNDDVIFLLSGGGSALFEKPLCSLQYLQSITDKLLKCGANITEINTIRKCLSVVKGGKFSKWCQPAHVYNYILSDVLSNRLDIIASGPTVESLPPIVSAREINQKYSLNIPENYLVQKEILHLDNVTSTIIGSVDKLTFAAKEKCECLGYQATIVSNSIDINDLDFSKMLIEKACEYQNSQKSLAFIYGGETTVIVNGNGKGGRNQEIALACVNGLQKMKDTAIFSIGSDGTDGPTDAAGGYVDTTTFDLALQRNLDISLYLNSNDSYHALQALNSLIITGPTNTNVNDLTVILIKR